MSFHVLCCLAFLKKPSNPASTPFLDIKALKIITKERTTPLGIVVLKSGNKVNHCKDYSVDPFHPKQLLL